MAKEYDHIWNINLRHLKGYSFVRIGSVPGQAYRKAKTSDKHIAWTFNKAENDQAYRDELQAFLGVCDGSRRWDDRLCSGFEAAHVCRIIAACRESSKFCRVVRV